MLIFLIAYGFTAFVIGKQSAMSTKLSGAIASVKGATTTKILETPIESPIPANDTQTNTVLASSVKSCANTHFGFELTYPKDWFTTFSAEEKKCSYFAPYSFVIPPDVSGNFVPIAIEVIEREKWEETNKFYEVANELQNVSSVTNLTIGDKSVKKIEASTTALTFVKRGLVKVTYLIFNPEKPIVVSYQQQDEKENVEKNKQIIQEMVESLKYF